jgi:hypothetical protein
MCFAFICLLRCFSWLSAFWRHTKSSRRGAAVMPEICRFYGIITHMFLIDPEPPPRHIHILMICDTPDFHRIDPDWCCLEFNHGQVDIEPQSLYRFAH